MAEIDPLTRTLAGAHRYRIEGTFTITMTLSDDGGQTTASSTTGLVRAVTFPGDANLDGLFDTADLVQVFIAGEYEDGIEGNSTWSEGDWNGDGDLDTADLVAAFVTGRYEVNLARVAASIDWLFAHSGRVRKPRSFIP